MALAYSIQRVLTMFIARQSQYIENATTRTRILLDLELERMSKQDQQTERHSAEYQRGCGDHHQQAA